METFPVTGEFPAQRPVTRSFDVFLDLRLNKRLSKKIVGLVIWDAIAPIMTPLLCHRPGVAGSHYAMAVQSLPKWTYSFMAENNMNAESFHKNDM